MNVKRYEGYRYLGARDTMVVYDVSDEADAAELVDRMETDGLYGRNLIQTFGPDTLPEARNRGFTPRY